MEISTIMDIRLNKTEPNYSTALSDICVMGNKRAQRIETFLFNYFHNEGDLIREEEAAYRLDITIEQLKLWSYSKELNCFEFIFKVFWAYQIEIFRRSHQAQIRHLKPYTGVLKQPRKVRI